MPGTYSQLLLHIVFSTHHRRPLISPVLAERLYSYLGGIVRAEGGVLLAIGGIADHVHLYIRCRPDQAVSDLVRVLKSRSTKWVRAEFAGMETFGWQEGFSVFSVSKSREESLRSYIARQAEHHERRDFASEIRWLLEQHGVDFDERYLLEIADE